MTMVFGAATAVGRSSIGIVLVGRSNGPRSNQSAWATMAMGLVNSLHLRSGSGSARVVKEIRTRSMKSCLVILVVITDEAVRE